MEPHFKIRLIEPGDCAAVLEIYKPYVESTYITFEYFVPTLTEFSEKINTIIKDYPWLVCVKDDKIVGYAYGSKHRPKTAYQWSPESTIYIAAETHNKGIGRVLYQTLFSILKLQGYFNVFAGVALPNDQSEGFHRALGFEEIGTFKNIGCKLGSWHDTRWFQLTLEPHRDNPQPPKTFTEVSSTSAFNDILQQANYQLNQK